MARLELPNGQWAELRDRLSHGAAKELRKAFIRSRSDPEAMMDVAGAYVRAFVRNWHVTDPDGNPVALADGDAVERASDEVVDAIFDAAFASEQGATSPNPSTSEPSIT